jgi:hypothetical protein
MVRFDRLLANGRRAGGDAISQQRPWPQLEDRVVEDVLLGVRECLIAALFSARERPNFVPRGNL